MLRCTPQSDVAFPFAAAWHAVDWLAVAAVASLAVEPGLDVDPRLAANPRTAVDTKLAVEPGLDVDPRTEVDTKLAVNPVPPPAADPQPAVFKR